VTEPVQNIKRQVQSLPTLRLPIGKGQFIIENDTSNSAWDGVDGVLIEKILEDEFEEVCAYT